MKKEEMSRNITLIGIAAIDLEGNIGLTDGRIHWNCKEDLKNFRKATLNHPIIMGRKTFDSIGRPLPKRRNLILSNKITNIEGCEVFNSTESLLNSLSDDTIAYVCGGAKVYQSFMPLISKFILTEINHTPEKSLDYVKLPTLDTKSWFLWEEVIETNSCIKRVCTYKRY